MCGGGWSKMDWTPVATCTWLNTDKNKVADGQMIFKVLDLLKLIFSIKLWLNKWTVGVHVFAVLKTFSITYVVFN